MQEEFIEHALQQTLVKFWRSVIDMILLVIALCWAALAIAFNNTEVIELFTKLIKAHVTLKDGMPHFLEVFNKPEIIKRLAELVHKFESDLERPVTESAAVEPIEEDIEKHDELNPVLFIDNKTQT